MLSVLLSVPAAGAPRPAVAQQAPFGDTTPSEVGTVGTLAGPTWCDGVGRLDPRASEVRSLAVNAKGTVYVETGPPDAGLVVGVNVNGQVRRLGTGLRSRPITPAVLGVGPPAATGRIAPDRVPEVVPPNVQEEAGGVPGGVLVAIGTTLNTFDTGPPETFPGLGPAVTAAGYGASGPGDDGGIRALFGDAAGNLYVAVGRADGVAIFYLNRTDGPVVRRGPGLGTDGAAVAVNAAALLAEVEGGSPADVVAVVAEGDLLYVASTGAGANPMVRAFNLGPVAVDAHGAEVAAGGVEVVAGGTGPPGVGGDDGPARSASFSTIGGMAVDRGGGLLLADTDNHRVRRVDPSGTVSTVAGDGTAGFDGNDRPAAQARLNRPSDVKVSPSGDVFIADTANGQVRRVDGAGVIHAFAGKGSGLAWKCEEVANPPERGPALDRPVALAADGAGNTFVALSEARAGVVRVGADGRVSRVVGLAEAERTQDGCRPALSCPSGDGGPVVDASLGRPKALAAVRSGLYVLDGERKQIRFVNLGPKAQRVHGVKVGAGAIAVVAGAGPEGGDDAGNALQRRFSGEGALAADPSGNLFLADHSLRRVFRIDTQGEVTVLSEPGGAGRERCCRNPTSLVADPAGNLYIADRFERRVWYMNLGTEAVVVHGRPVPAGATVAVVGSGRPGVGGDSGPALDAPLQAAGDLALDRAGNLYLADPSEHAVRRVDPAGFIITVVGTGQFGFNGDGLKGPFTFLDGPDAVAVDACSNLLVADGGNNRVRRLVLGGTCELAGAEPGGSGRSWPLGLLVVGGTAVTGLGIVMARIGRHRGSRKTLNRSQPGPGGRLG